MDANSTSTMLQTMLFLIQANSTASLETMFNDRAEHSPDFNETRCFGVYGCFSVTGPWMIENRPQAHPFSPSIIDVKFPTFTNNNRDKPRFIDVNDPETILDVGINPRGRIYVIAHGFLESGDRPWVRKLMNALLDYDKNSTVVVVDWKGGSSPPYYQAVANIRLCGAITAHLIYAIFEELGLENLEKVHLIGHSLGSHLSGYAGYHLQRDFGMTVGRITALDPAEPFFANTETIVRLDQSDAYYVDVIHSDIAYFVSGGFGMKQKIGHVDFYPNGGREQPGCLENKLQIGCNHIRSIQLFTESINSNCPFMSITCESYEAFKKGKCPQCNRDGNYCIRFGFHSRHDYERVAELSQSDGSPIATYFLTSDTEPYCAAHYKVTVKVSDSEESLNHGGEIGVLFMKLRGSNAETRRMGFNPNMPVYFSPGSDHTFLVIGDDAGKDIAAAKVEYTTKQTFNPLTWRIFTPRVFIQFIVIESMEHNRITKICPENKSAVKADSSVLFKEEFCFRPTS